MREIKFRVRIRAKRVSDAHRFHDFDYWTLDELLQAKANYGDGNDFEVASVDEFTGLKDRNGKEIWEGDVVAWGWQNSEIGAVEWGDYSWRVYDKSRDLSYFQHPEAYEVLGNRFENPELLPVNEPKASNKP